MCDVLLHTEKRIVGGIWMSQRQTTKTARMVKRLRRTLGLTQEQFAVELGVTFSTVNRWENARSTPSPLAMERIRQILSRIEDTTS